MFTNFSKILVVKVQKRALIDNLRLPKSKLPNFSKLFGRTGRNCYKKLIFLNQIFTNYSKILALVGGTKKSPKNNLFHDFLVNNQSVCVCRHPWVVCTHDPAEEDGEGLFDIELVGGRQTFVEVVVNGGQRALQLAHRDLRVCPQGVPVQVVLPERLYHVVDVHKVN